MNIFEDFCRIVLCIILATVLLAGGALYVYKTVAPHRPPSKYTIEMSKLNYRLLPGWAGQTGHHSANNSDTGNRIGQRTDGTTY